VTPETEVDLGQKIESGVVEEGRCGRLRRRRRMRKKGKCSR